MDSIHVTRPHLFLGSSNCVTLHTDGLSAIPWSVTALSANALSAKRLSAISTELPTRPHDHGINTNDTLPGLLLTCSLASRLTPAA